MPGTNKCFGSIGYHNGADTNGVDLKDTEGQRGVKAATATLEGIQGRLLRNFLVSWEVDKIRVGVVGKVGMRGLRGHDRGVLALTVLPGGELASGSADNMIKLWDVKTGECVRTLTGHSGVVCALTVLPGG